MVPDDVVAVEQPSHAAVERITRIQRRIEQTQRMQTVSGLLGAVTVMAAALVSALGSTTGYLTMMPFATMFLAVVLSAKARITDLEVVAQALGVEERA